MQNALILNVEREKSGLVDSRMAEHASRTLTDHLNDFCDTLRSKNSTAKHIKTTQSRLERVFSGCSFRRLLDLDRDRASNWLRSQREADEFGIQTSNYYVTACKQFGKWLMESDRLPRNPFAGLPKLNSDTDQRVVRRALSDAELSQLITTTAESEIVFRDLPGVDRAILYAVASFTGLRVNELASLTVDSIDFEAGIITVDAAYSKRRRKDDIPLHPYLADMLRPWLAERVRTTKDEQPATLKLQRDVKASEKLWSGTWSERSAKMIRSDLEEAGIPRETDAGVCDFHALRHTFCTRLAKSGMSPKEAQTLARHSSITLTMDRYSHLQKLEIESAMHQLPDLPEKTSESEQATGTDGKPAAALVARMVAHNPDIQCDSVRRIETNGLDQSESGESDLTAQLMRFESDCEPLKVITPGGIRTPDLSIRSALLYPAELLALN